MADIQQYLDDILKARYGKDVRQSIHDAINTINEAVIDSGLDAGNLPVNKGVLSNGIDLNDIDIDSLYFISGTVEEGSGNLNVPFNEAGEEEYSGWLLTRKIANSSSKVKFQVYISWLSGIVYSRRTDVQGVWNSWRDTSDGYTNPIDYVIEQFDLVKNVIGKQDGYYSYGEWVAADGWQSSKVPVTEKSKYYYTYTNVFVAFYKGDEFVAQKSPEKITFSPIEGATANIYRITTPPNIDFDHVYIPYKDIANCLLYCSPFDKPTFLFDRDVASDKIVVSGGRIVNKEEPDHLELSNIHDGVITFYGTHAESDEWIHTDMIFLKKGTVVDTKSTGLTFSIRGMTVNNFIYVSGLERYVLQEDVYCSINCMVRNPKWTDNIPNLSKLEKFCFIRIIRNEDRIKNPWKGKTWWAYGTSITDIGPNDTTGNNGHSGKYPLSLEAYSELVRNNGAIGSGGILDDKADNRNYRLNILKTPKDTDLVTIETLPNDDYTNKLGDIGDTEPSTICGALTQCFEYLTTNTRARIVLLIVTGTIHAISSETPEVNYKPYETTRKNWRKAVEKITELAKLYGVTVIDADANALDWGRRKTGITYKDHVHLNYLGGEIFGRYIWEQLKNIQPYTQGF